MSESVQWTRLALELLSNGVNQSRMAAETGTSDGARGNNLMICIQRAPLSLSSVRVMTVMRANPDDGERDSLNPYK